MKIYLGIMRVDAGQGEDEQRSESYMKYEERVAESLTQSSATNASGVSSSARKQAGMARGSRRIKR